MSYEPPNRFVKLALDDGNVIVKNALLNGTEYVGTKGSLKTKQFIELLTGTKNPGLLPTNLVWISDDHRTMIVRDTSKVRNINFLYGEQSSGGLETNFTLLFPNLYYGITVTTFDKHHVTALFTHNYKKTYGVNPFRFFNVYNDGKICASFASDYQLEDDSLPMRIDIAIDQFWTSIFNLEVKEMLQTPLMIDLTPSNQPVSIINQNLTAVREHRQALQEYYGEDILSEDAVSIGTNLDHQSIEQQIGVFREVIFEVARARKAYDDIEVPKESVYSDSALGPLVYWDFLTALQAVGALESSQLLKRIVGGNLKNASLYILEDAIHITQVNDGIDQTSGSSLINRLVVSVQNEALKMV